MKQKNFETILYSSAGVAAMFVIMLALYVVIGALKVRADVTAERIHTLSPGTKKILSHLDSRITIRFYCSQDGNIMPPALRTYSHRIEDLLTEYKEAAPGKIVIEKFDPQPDSDAEDAARLNGVTGQAVSPYVSDKIYIGIVVSLLDDKFVLPWLPPDRERLLEYDMSRAILRVVNHTPPVVGIMSSLPVFGDVISPMMMNRDDHPAEAWAFVSELKKDFRVRELSMASSNIPPDVKVLLVAHPQNITDTTQYAIDQFVLRGGKLLAFLDPHAFFDKTHDQQNNAFQIMGDTFGQSTLDKLLKAWGLTMDLDKVVADTSFASRKNNGEMIPSVLVITRAGIDQNDAVTSQIDNLLLPFPGAFLGKPVEGLAETVLVKSSRNAQMVDTLQATAGGQRILADFKAANIEYPLIAHLTGKFKTAFPHREAGQLAESQGSGEVILVADSDMLNDKVCVRVQNNMGHRAVTPMSGNLNFVQSVVEQFSGDDDLIGARSRASRNRPFTRVKEMETEAGKQWEEKIQVLETKQREMQRKVSEFQTQQEGGADQKLILTPGQEKEFEDYQKTLVDVGKDLKHVRKSLRKDTDSLAFWTKVINIGAMPVLVALSGLVLAVFKRKRRAAK